MITKCNYVGFAGSFQSKDGTAYAKFLFEDPQTNRIISVVTDDIQREFKADIPYYIETFKGENGWVSRLLNVV